jgi:hypothetical protein
MLSNFSNPNHPTNLENIMFSKAFGFLAQIWVVRATHQSGEGKIDGTYTMANAATVARFVGQNCGAEMSYYGIRGVELANLISILIDAIEQTVNTLTVKIDRQGGFLNIKVEEPKWQWAVPGQIFFDQTYTATPGYGHDEFDDDLKIEFEIISTELETFSSFTNFDRPNTEDGAEDSKLNKWARNYLVSEITSHCGYASHYDPSYPIHG